MKTKIQKGFTLIELMITVAIVGVLLSIVVPTYKDYILRAKLIEGRMALASLKINMEKQYQNTGDYRDACQANSIAKVPVLKSFKISCEINNPNKITSDSFIIEASGYGFTYSINESNFKRTTAVPSGYDLPISEKKQCWIVGKNRACSEDY